MKKLPAGAEFKDFDAVEYEVFDKKEYFLYEGEYFEADLNVEAGKVLRWMRMGQTIEAVPEMLVLFVGEEQFEAICDKGAQWPKLQAVVKWLAEKLGGLGN